MHTAEGVLATAGPAAGRFVVGGGLFILRWIGSTVEKASLFALVILVMDALDRGRQPVTPDSGARLRWIFIVSAGRAFLVHSEKLIVRRKQVASAVNAT